MRPTPRALQGWAIGGLLAGIAFLPICDLHFDCGCTWPGLGHWAHCDILTAGPPDCPWCDHLGSAALSALFAYGVGLAAALRFERRHGLALVTLASLGATVAGLLAAGVVTALVVGRAPLAGLLR